jgi:hypothetical protein
MKRTESARKNSRSSASSSQRASRRGRTFVVCLKNAGYPASLEARKIYRTKPDRKAEERGFIRVVDESGQDYLYPEKYFAPIEMPASARRAFSAS